MRGCPATGIYYQLFLLQTSGLAASDSQVWPCRVLISATALAGLFPPFDTGLQEAPGLGSACMWEKRLPRRPCMVVSSKMRDGSVGHSTTANPENLKSVPGTHMGVSRELTPQLSSDFNTCPAACKHLTHTQTLRHPPKDRVTCSSSNTAWLWRCH